MNNFVFKKQYFYGISDFSDLIVGTYDGQLLFKTLFQNIV